MVATDTQQQQAHSSMPSQSSWSLGVFRTPLLIVISLPVLLSPFSLLAALALYALLLSAVGVYASYMALRDYLHLRIPQLFDDPNVPASGSTTKLQEAAEEAQLLDNWPLLRNLVLAPPVAMYVASRAVATLFLHGTERCVSVGFRAAPALFRAIRAGAVSAMQFASDVVGGVVFVWGYVKVPVIEISKTLHGVAVTAMDVVGDAGHAVLAFALRQVDLVCSIANWVLATSVATLDLVKRTVGAIYRPLLKAASRSVRFLTAPLRAAVRQCVSLATRIAPVILAAAEAAYARCVLIATATLTWAKHMAVVSAERISHLAILVAPYADAACARISSLVWSSTALTVRAIRSLLKPSVLLVQSIGRVLSPVLSILPTIFTKTTSLVDALLTHVELVATRFAYALVRLPKVTHRAAKPVWAFLHRALAPLAPVASAAYAVAVAYALLVARAVAAAQTVAWGVAESVGRETWAAVDRAKGTAEGVTVFVRRIGSMAPAH
ncbi:hypothetical protein HKX48_007171 [Thoreauomyces humboldtii]|nr:hypothetical protein HKX48_007171 [Thoreauomyces humboldtii]